MGHAGHAAAQKGDVATVTSTSELLKAGIRAAKARNADEALALLKQVVELEPYNGTAWLWLSDVVGTDEQRIVCLQNVLAIDPDNEAAQRGLSILRRRAATIKPLPEPRDHMSAAGTAAVDLSARPLPEAAVQGEEPALPPPGAGTPATAPKTRNTWLGIPAALVVSAILFLLWQWGGTSLSSSSGPLSPTTYRATYKVTALGSRAFVTYVNQDGGMEQLDVALPWQKSISVQRGDILTVSAASQIESDIITCEIELNGARWKHSTSHGAYVIAVCGGLVGED
jgi:hypothetical protein